MFELFFCDTNMHKKTRLCEAGRYEMLLLLAVLLHTYQIASLAGAVIIVIICSAV